MIGALVVLPHLERGGAQKQALLLAQQLEESQSLSVIVLCSELTTTGVDFAREVLPASTGVRIVGSLSRSEQAIFKSLEGLLARAKHAVSHYYPEGYESIRSGRLFWLRISLASFFLALMGSPKVIRIWYEIYRNLEPDVLRHLTINPSIAFHSIAIKRAIERFEPEVVFSFLSKTNIATALAATGATTTFGISERNDLTKQPNSPGVVQLQAELYRRADFATANTRANAMVLEQRFNCRKVRFFPNDYSHLSKPLSLSREINRHIIVLSRLEPQKRVFEIVESFVDSGLSQAGWKLDVFGSGSEGKRIEDLARDSLGHVQLKGAVDPATIKWDCYSFFISASDYEGSSNSLHEAVANGQIPIVRDSVDEMREILQDDYASALTFSDFSELISTLRSLEARLSELGSLREVVVHRFETYWNQAQDLRNDFFSDLAGTLQSRGFRNSD